MALGLGWGMREQRNLTRQVWHERKDGMSHLCRMLYGLYTADRVVVHVMVGWVHPVRDIQVLLERELRGRML